MRTSELIRIHDLVQAGGGACTLSGDPSVIVGPDVVIDSRKATPGCLFVALPGERVDGNDYVGAAAKAGASAAMCTRLTDAGIPSVLVPDALAALTSLARGVVEEEKRRGMTTLAITGSSGKTSTKDLLAQVLEASGPTVSPFGSFNNEIGNPLTACGVDESTRYLVSEMGARGPGHIRYLCSIVSPDIGVVLNVGTAHIGEFGSRAAIAAAKGELVAAARQWAVLNADDELVRAMPTSARVAGFSLGADLPQADLLVRASDLEADDLDRYACTLHVDGELVRVQLTVPGRHQVANASAACAAAMAAGMSLADVAEALEKASARSHWRMEIHELPDGAAVINDAYNANPDSMAAALRSLAEIGAARAVSNPSARTIAVLGDMLELGSEAAAMHRDVGELAGRLGIDEVVAVGEFANDLAVGAESGGAQARVEDPDRIASTLELARGDVVLVKASRGLALERIADALVERG